MTDVESVPGCVSCPHTDPASHWQPGEEMSGEKSVTRAGRTQLYALEKSDKTVACNNLESH